MNRRSFLSTLRTELAECLVRVPGFIAVQCSVLLLGLLVMLWPLGMWSARDDRDYWGVLFLRWTLLIGWGILPLAMLIVVAISVIRRKLERNDEPT